LKLILRTYIKVHPENLTNINWKVAFTKEDFKTLQFFCWMISNNSCRYRQ
jgi:hypothetical protein